MRQAIILLAAFACGFVYDYVWARTVQCVQLKKAVLAANLGIVLYICTLMATVMVVEKCLWAVVLYGIGNWLGVYLAVRGKK
jgi:hypothetical protein